MPATQLQIAMGIPLDRMPQVRSFYGLSEKDGVTPCRSVVEPLPGVYVGFESDAVRLKTLWGDPSGDALDHT